MSLRRSVPDFRERLKGFGNNSCFYLSQSGAFVAVYIVEYP